MSVYVSTLPVRKSSKSSKIEWEPSTNNEFCPLAGHLLIETDRADVLYTVTEWSPGWDGRAFHLVKVTVGTDKTEESYSCFIARNGQDKSCECRGFQRYGYCKHSCALMNLINNGQI